jgi:AraC-like DNA-binding protein
MTGRASPNTVSNAYLHALLDHAQACGLPPERLLDGTSHSLDDRDGRVTEAAANALFERAALLLDDPDLGLHVGEGIRPGHYGALGYVAMNCGTLAEALDSLRRYQALVIDLGEVGIAMQAGHLVLRWQPETERPYRQLAEFNLAGLLSFTRWLIGSAAQPAWIDLAYPAPASLREHQRIFACPLRFDTESYRLALPQSALGTALIQPDPAMRELMQRLAEQQLAALPRGDDLLAQARAMIAKGLRQPPVELDRIATQLALSPRSLQRKLADAGLSFTQLIEQVRRELAERHLRDATMNLTDVAFLLGYSEQSAFQRAFKRWSGQTPAQYRAQASTQKAGLSS